MNIRTAVFIFACVSMTALPGCEGPALVAEAIRGPEKVPPAYVLPDAPTLIMVDDPQHHLDNPGLARQIATTAIHYLRFHEALPESEFIEPREMAKLEAQLADQWPSTPIDEVGRRLDAQQVIHAKVQSVTLHVAESLYRPEAQLEIKVVSAETGERLWPPAPPLADPDRPTPGHTINIQLDYVSKESRYVGDSTPDDLARRIADEAGLRVAQLFYEWRRPAPGAGL